MTINHRAGTDLSAYRAALISWRNIVSHAVAWGIAFAETDEQHEPWLDLAQQLDEAGLNIEHDVDKVTSSFGKDPRGVWKPPTTQREEHAGRIAADNPWTTSRSSADDGSPFGASEPACRIIVNHLAEMLLGDKPSDVRARAFSIARELQQAGLDLGADIADRTQQLDPWAPPVRATEPPF